VGASQRRKGAVYEREVMSAFSAALGAEFKRNIGQARDGGNDGDVGPLVLEMKRRKSLKTFMDWYRQAQAATPAGRIPVVVMREDAGESMVMLSLEDFLRLTLPELKRALSESGLTRSRNTSESTAA
jgi:hypothetical protein